MPTCNKHLSLYTGVFCITSGLLLYEISLTRLFAIAQSYHFAFLVIGIAMLGLGAAGAILAALRPEQSRITTRLLAAIAAAFAASVPVAFAITNQIPFDQQRIAWDHWQLLYLLIYFTVLAIPPFAAGLLLALVYRRHAEHIGCLYFFDLFGAATGAIAVLKMTTLADGLGGLWAAAFCGLLSGMCLKPAKNTVILGAAGSLALAAIWLQPPRVFRLNISEYKPLRQLLTPADAKILRTDWRVTGRYDYVQSPMVHFAPGLSLQYDRPLPGQIGVVIDAGLTSAATRWPNERHDLEFIDFLPAALPYHLAAVDTVLVIEPLAGLDVLTGLYFGARCIDAVGIHTAIAQQLNRNFDDFTGGLFHRPAVQIHTRAARAFLKTTPRRYDLIGLPIGDSFGATATGIRGPGEDYTLTVEAFAQALGHLQPGGCLYATCYLLPPLRMELRLVALAVQALERRGVASPAAHLLAIRTVSTFSLLVKKSRVSPQDVVRLQAFCDERGFDRVHYPGMPASEANRLNRFPEPQVFKAVQAIVHDSTRQHFFKNYLFDVRPVSDDRPFAGHFFRWGKMGAEYRSLHGNWAAFFESSYVVAIMFLQACLTGAAFILLPLLVRRRRRSVRRQAGRAVACLGYFFSIGMGFMLIEISLLQRFILFLDHPIYATSLVIAGLLVFSGLGSWASQRISGWRAWSLRRHLVFLCLLLVLYLFILPSALDVLLGSSFVVRHAAAIAIIALPAFFMGFPFPAAIRQLANAHADWIPWAYGANAFASVIATALAMLLALDWGFSAVHGVAVGFYVLAAGWGKAGRH